MSNRWRWLGSFIRRILRHCRRHRLRMPRIVGDFRQPERVAGPLRDRPTLGWPAADARLAPRAGPRPAPVHPFGAELASHQRKASSKPNGAHAMQNHHLLLTAFGALLLAGGTHASDCNYEKAIDVTLDLAGSELLTVAAAAGDLTVTGRAG